MPSSRESSQPRDRTRLSYVSSCIGKWVLYHEHHLGRPDVIHLVNMGTAFPSPLVGIIFFIVAQRFGIYGTKNFLTDNKIITDKEERMKRYLLGFPPSTFVIFNMSQVEAELKIVSPRTNALK